MAKEKHKRKDRMPDWKYWGSMDAWQLWQGVALTLYIAPEKVKLAIKDGCLVFDEQQEFLDRLDAACLEFGGDREQQAELCRQFLSSN